MRRSQEDFDAEIRSHLELEAEQLRAEGLAPAEAERAARRRFGSITRVRERFYDTRSGRWLEELGADLRHAARVLGRSRLPALTAVSVLALGIGATVALYSAISGVVLRPLPFRAPDRLVMVGVAGRQSSMRAGASVPDLADWRAMTRSFEGLAAYRQWGFELEGRAGSGAVEPDRVVGARVTADLFPLLGVSASAGRVFVPGEDQPGRERVVVLSDSLWRSRYGASRGIVGTPIRLNGSEYLVVGVAPGGEMLPHVSLWVPYAFAPYELQQRGDRALTVVGRLKPGVTLARARGDLQSVVRELGRRYPDANADWRAAVEPLRDALIGNSREALFILFAATCSLLIVSCANLANVMLAGAIARKRELALRSALGAPRLRVIRQLAGEASLLVIAGGLGGLALAVVATRWLSALGPQYLPRSSGVRLDGEALLGATALVALTALSVAGVVGLMTTRLDLGSGLRQRSSTDARRRFGLRDAFVVAQLAIAVVLVVGGDLLVSSFRRIQAVPLGLSPGGVLAAQLSLPGGRYPGDTARIAFFDAVLGRAGALPGVRAVAIGSRPPFSASPTAGVMNTVLPLDGPPARASDVTRAAILAVGSSYFRTLGIRVLAGRAIDATDRQGGPRVVVIDQTVARTLDPGGAVVGRRVRLGGGTGGDTAARVIVGVVAPVRMSDPTRPAEPAVYLPYTQSAWPTMTLFLRTDAVEPIALAPALRRAVAAVDPQRPVYNVRSLDDALGLVLAGRRLQMLLLAGFGASALAVALLGVYGLLAFAVRQRDREFGIRLALGATPRNVLATVLGHVGRRVAAGVVAGGVLAATGSAFLRGLLFGLSPWDPRSFLAGFVAVAAMGLVAGYFPAARATRADPMTALRAD